MAVPTRAVSGAMFALASCATTSPWAARSGQCIKG